MKPGKFNGQCITAWVNTTWDKVIQPNGHKGEWFSYTTSNGNITVTPEHEMFTDGGSIPKPIRRIFPDMEREFKPAYIIHDKNYKDGILTRRKSDFILAESMYTITEYLPGKRFIVWFFVRLGGWNAWRKHRKNVSPVYSRVGRTAGAGTPPSQSAS